MAFVLLLMMAMSVLVRVETAASATTIDSLRAKQNALLGLQVALGDLQKYTGDDRRITATADLLNNDPADPFSNVAAENSNWTSVYDAESGDWLRYLVSGVGDAITAAETFVPPINTSGELTNSDSVIMVGEHSVDLSQDEDGNTRPDDMVVVPKVDIESTTSARGHYAWWVGDEGVKARFNLNGIDEVDGKVPAERSSAIFNPRADLRLLDGFSTFPQGDTTADDALLSIYNLPEINFIDAVSASSVDTVFHDITTYSAGLFTNTKDGGLRKDLSMAFEMSDADFNLSPDFAQQEAIPYVDFQAAYVFSESISDGAIVHGPTWHLMRNFYRQYHDVEYTALDSSDWPSIQARSDLPLPDSYHNDKAVSHLWDLYTSKSPDPMGLDTEDVIYDYSTPRQLIRNTDASLGPIISQIQFIYSLRVRPIDLARDEAPTNPSHTHTLDIIWDPVVTVWNPYNIDLEFYGLKVRSRQFPVQFDFRTTDPTNIINGTTEGTYFNNIKIQKLTLNSSDNWQENAMWFYIGNDGDLLRMAPGELRVYSLANTSPVFFSELLSTGGTVEIEAKEGWNNNGGVAIPTGITGSIDVADDQEVLVRIEDSDTATIDGFLITDWSRRLVGPDSDSTQPGLWELFFTMDYPDNPNWWGAVHWLYAPYVSDPEGVSSSAEDSLPKNSFSQLSNATNGKSPFAQLRCYLKPASDLEAVALAGFSNLRAKNTGLLQPEYRKYKVSVPAWRRDLEAVTALPGTVAIGPSNRGYWGPDNASGLSHVVMYEVPTAPLSSLGQFMHANVGIRGYDALHAMGNSFPSPYIPLTDKVGIHSVYSDYNVYIPDYSYLLNEALWDGYFFSTLTPQITPIFEKNQDFETYLTDFFAGNASALNPRIHGYLSSGQTPASVVGNLVSDGEVKSDAYSWTAANLLNLGAFNVNSTSVDAWASLLSGLRDVVLTYLNSEASTFDEDAEDGVALSGFTLPNGSSSEAWQGFSRLSDEQVLSLAGHIVDQVRTRGPFTSLGQFVNRSLEVGPNGLGGVLQNALAATESDASNPINSNFDFSDVSYGVESASEGSSGHEAQSLAKLDYLDWDNVKDSTGATLKVGVGAAGYLTQGDLLVALGNLLTVRSDTFRIRTYGEVLDPVLGETVSEAWLEAVVQRLPEPVERASADPSSIDYNEPASTSDFGRRYKIISIKWLEPNEI
jgi:hypothetical protein